MTKNKTAINFLSQSLIMFVYLKNHCIQLALFFFLEAYMPSKAKKRNQKIPTIPRVIVNTL